MNRNAGIVAATLVILALLIWSSTAITIAQTSAQIADYGTNKDTYRGGETATGYMTIQNTGSTPINNVDATATVYSNLPFVGYTSVFSQDIPAYNRNIQPGESRRIDFSVQVPAEYAGMSTAGNYDLQVSVNADGQDIGSFTKSVTVT